MEQKILFNIYNLVSPDSAIELDNKLEDIDGVIEANTNYSLQQTEVTFSGKRATLEKIIRCIRSLGYDIEIAHE